MAGKSQAGKRSLIGFVSTISWLVLLAAFVATAVSMATDSLNHLGNSASSIVQAISKNQASVDSIIDEFKKNADPQTVAEIEKNRTQIESTIASLGGSKEFQDSLASTLNQISQAILKGSSSVKIDFTQLATLVASKVNEASKSVVISQKEIAKIKPQVLVISKQSKVVTNFRSRIKAVTMAWLLWLVLLGVLYLLKGWKVLRTAGWQLFSVGIIFLTVRLTAPIVANFILNKSTVPAYQRDLVPRIFNSLTSHILMLSIIVMVVGVAIAIGEKLTRKKIRVGQI